MFLLPSCEDTFSVLSSICQTHVPGFQLQSGYPLINSLWQYVYFWFQFTLHLANHAAPSA